MPEVDELLDLLARIAGILTETDLLDPEMAALLSQAVSILDPAAEPLPKAMVEYLERIEDRVQRFKEAALKASNVDPVQLKALVDSMKAAGLLKHGGSNVSAT